MTRRRHPTGINWAALPSWAAEGLVAGVDPQCLNPKELMALLDYERAVKTPYELACLRKASEMGAQGHTAALAAFHRGGSEYDAHMSYLAACQQREEEMPYNNIVAYNENAAVLHYQHLERTAPVALALFFDRRRSPIPRLCGGYHAHLCARRRALR